jgi:hypothetical protein
MCEIDLYIEKIGNLKNSQDNKNMIIAEFVEFLYQKTSILFSGCRLYLCVDEYTICIVRYMPEDYCHPIKASCKNNIEISRRNRTGWVKTDLSAFENISAKNFHDALLLKIKELLMDEDSKSLQLDNAVRFIFDIKKLLI